MCCHSRDENVLAFHTQKPPSCFRQDRNSGLPLQSQLLLCHSCTTSSSQRIWYKYPPHSTSVQTPPKTVLLFCWVTDSTYYTTLQLPHIIQVGTNQSVISHLQSGLCPATQTLPTETKTVSPNHREKKINSPAHPHTSYPGMLSKCLG